MNGVTHMIGGVTTAVLLGHTTYTELAVVLVSSLLPDIDRPNSLLGRFIPVLSHVLEKMGKRTLTHSLLFGAVIGISLYLIFPSVLTAFIIGFLSHIILDLFTGRVALFWPLLMKFGIPLFGIPPIVVETFAIAGWGVWMAFQGFDIFKGVF